MEFINFGVGVFLILLGIMVFNYPNIISGYNTLPPNQKEKVNINGLKSFLRSILIFMGILVIVDYYVLRAMGYLKIADYISFPIIILGTVYMAINAGQFFRK